jgi:hypothetical protein
MKTSVHGNDDGSITLTAGAVCVIFAMAVFSYAAFAGAMVRQAKLLEKKIERHIAEKNAQYRKGQDEAH